MKSSKQEIIIDHSPKQLYEIVLDIEKYPDFIPWCREIIIKYKSKNEILADMKVKYSFFSMQTFTSNVHFDKKNLTIHTKYIEGPLNDLKTKWVFRKLEKNKTKVVFILNFEFKKFFHQKLAELFLILIEEKMVNSFKKRADEILN